MELKKDRWSFFRLQKGGGGIKIRKIQNKSFVIDYLDRQRNGMKIYLNLLENNLKIRKIQNG